MAKKRDTIEAAYVWIFLPGQAEPVVCGQLFDRGTWHDFGYGRSYRDRVDAIPLDHKEMPLAPGLHRSMHELHGALRDAAPDAWGRRVLMRRLGMTFERGDRELRELDFLVRASRERIGALHFQLNADRYEAPERQEASLSDLLHAAELLERDLPLPPELEEALLHGTSIGGARPKALLDDHGHRRVIAKFSSTTDTWPVVRFEALGMKLAALAGIRVPPVELRVVDGKDVLLVERFDRVRRADGAFTRRHFFSSLTALVLSEFSGRYASYPDLADFLAKYSEQPVVDCRELYRRMVFNMMIGNTDDHARNHAVFWDGRRCSLTPAYDVCVMRRTGEEAGQAMGVGEQGNASVLANALTSCARFGLDTGQAEHIHQELRAVIQDNWRGIARDVGLQEPTINQMDGTSILSPALFRV